MESPPQLPSGARLSKNAHDKLVKDGVISEKDCTDPWDLADVASVIFEKKGTQEELVQRFPVQQMKRAKPNQGYKYLAALMSERCISYALSLNYDLAVQNAVSELGLANEIDCIENHGTPLSTSPTVIHLHGCINCHPDALVMRTEAMKEEWKNNWEQIIATQVLAAPRILFAGLGSPAPVLSETIDLIKNAIGSDKPLYQSDIAKKDDNKFANALGIAEGNYIQLGWTEVMSALAERLKIECIDTLKDKGKQLLESNGHNDDDVITFFSLADKFSQVSLLDFGKFSANLLLNLNSDYVPEHKFESQRYVHPMLMLVKGCEAGNFTVRPRIGGVWSIGNERNKIGDALLVSGGGTKSFQSIENDVRKLRVSLRENWGVELDMVVAHGINNFNDVGGMIDIVNADIREDLLDGPREPKIINASDRNCESIISDWLTDA